MIYRTMQPEYKPAEYLSLVKCAANRRLIDRFRNECCGLRVNTGCWADRVHLDRTDRLCLVCKSLNCVGDEQHLVFDCPAYSHIRVLVWVDLYLRLIETSMAAGNSSTQARPQSPMLSGDLQSLGLVLLQHPVQQINVQVVRKFAYWASFGVSWKLEYGTKLA